MKANELRIGNYVLYNKTHSEIGFVSEIKTSITPNIQYVGLNNRMDIYYQTKHLKPISITEEWLLKCGFYKCDNSLLCIDINESIKLVFTNFDNIPEICLKTDDGLHGAFKHIKSLHQLQNLYFALTGEELNVNL